MYTPNLTNGQGNVARKWLEIQVAIPDMRTEQQREIRVHALSSKYVVGKPSLVRRLVPFPTLVHNNVDDFGLVVDICCPGVLFQDLVHLLAEQRNIAARIFANGLDELSTIVSRILSAPVSYHAPAQCGKHARMT